MADFIVMAVLVVALVLAVRSMRREGVSCGGDCGSCAGGCSTPRIRLSEEQLKRLDEIKRKGEGAQ